MRIKAMAVVLGMLPAAAMHVTAQAVPTVETARGVCERFLDSVVAGDYTNAFDYLRGIPNNISDENVDELESLAIKQSATIEQAYGRTIDYLLVDERLVGDVALRLIYVVRHERHIIRWQFVYYKPRLSWQLNYLAFDDKLEELF